MSRSSRILATAAEVAAVIAATGIAAAAWRYALAPVRRGYRTRVAGRGRAPSGSETSAAIGGAREDTAEDADTPHVVLDTSPESIAAASGAALAHVLARPDSIRTRAQSAATIATAVAAALVVASITQITGNESEDWHWVTVGAVCVAIVLWMISVWRFVHVVALGPERDAPKDHDYRSLIKIYEGYSNQLRQSLRRAGHWSAAALAFTALAVALEIAERTHAREREHQLVLTPPGMSAVAAICGWDDWTAGEDARVNVRVATEALSNRVVKLHVLSRPLQADGTSQECAAATTEMRLPRPVILAAKDIAR